MLLEPVSISRRLRCGKVVTHCAQGKLVDFIHIYSRLVAIKLYSLDQLLSECIGFILIAKKPKIKITPSVHWFPSFNRKRDEICSDRSLSSSLRHTFTKQKSRPYAKYHLITFTNNIFVSLIILHSDERKNNYLT